MRRCRPFSSGLGLRLWRQAFPRESYFTRGKDGKNEGDEKASTELQFILIEMRPIEGNGRQRAPKTFLPAVRAR
jgi:hypothetical protein